MRHASITVGGMHRFESGDKFWAIGLSAKKLTTQFGKIGSPGQTRLKTFATTKEAGAAFELAILVKHKEGFTSPFAPAPSNAATKSKLTKSEATTSKAKTTASKSTSKSKPSSSSKSKPSSSSKATAASLPIVATSNPQLENAIAADPYDTEAYSVYADFLQGAGDPRGELIALQLANKQAAATKLIAKHIDYFLGPIAAHQKVYDIRYDDKTRKQVRDDAFTWKFGFIHGLRLSHNMYSVDNANDKFSIPCPLAEVFEAVLAHPSAKFLAEVVFSFNNDPSQGSLQSLIDVLAKKAPPTIRKLHFGDYLFAGGGSVEMYGNDTEISWYSVGNLGKLWKKVPGLQHLIVQGGSTSSSLGGGVKLGTLDLPSLVHAEFRTGGLEKANARAIAKANIPKIEHLDIWYGDDHYGGDATIKDAKLLVDRNNLPALRHLGLMNTQFADQLPALLASSKLTKQLAELDLSLGCMTEQGAQLLATEPAFAHLDKLDVSKNYLKPASIKALRKRFGKKLVDRGQRDDPADDPEDGPERRHPAITE